MEKLIFIYSLILLLLVVILLVVAGFDPKEKTDTHYTKNEKVKSGLVCLINLLILDLSWRVFPWKVEQPEEVFAALCMLLFSVLSSLSCIYLLYHLIADKARYKF